MSKADFYDDQLDDVETSMANIPTVSDLGQKIKNIYLSCISAPSLTRSQTYHASTTRKDHIIDKPRNFHRLSYEFDVDPLSFAELPTLITKSEHVCNILVYIALIIALMTILLCISMIGCVGKCISSISNSKTYSQWN